VSFTARPSIDITSILLPDSTTAAAVDKRITIHKQTRVEVPVKPTSAAPTVSSLEERTAVYSTRRAELFDGEEETPVEKERQSRQTIRQQSAYPRPRAQYQSDYQPPYFPMQSQMMNMQPNYANQYYPDPYAYMQQFNEQQQHHEHGGFHYVDQPQYQQYNPHWDPSQHNYYLQYQQRMAEHQNQHQYPNNDYYPLPYVIHDTHPQDDSLVNGLQEMTVTESTELVQPADSLDEPVVESVEPVKQVEQAVESEETTPIVIVQPVEIQPIEPETVKFGSVTSTNECLFAEEGSVHLTPKMKQKMDYKGQFSKK